VVLKFGVLERFYFQPVNRYVEKKPANGLPYLEVHFRLKNISDRAITICDYVGNQPLKVRWIGPDGKALRSDHYVWLRYVDLAGLTEKSFVTIPAGGVRRIGRQGKTLASSSSPPRKSPCASAK
jgi:hypothetical protein